RAAPDCGRHRANPWRRFGPRAPTCGRAGGAVRAGASGGAGGVTGAGSRIAVGAAQGIEPEIDGLGVGEGEERKALAVPPLPARLRPRATVGTCVGGRAAAIAAVRAAARVGPRTGELVLRAVGAAPRVLR